MSGAEHEAWLYLRNGRVSHAVRSSETQYAEAWCGWGPQWPDTWRGTGDQREYERAAALPRCQRCLAFLDRAAAAVRAVAARSTKATPPRL